jgi:hypothetical protein
MTRAGEAHRPYLARVLDALQTVAAE